MVVHVYSTIKMREIEAFINEQHIKKEDIVSIIQDSDKNFILTYFLYIPYTRLQALLQNSDHFVHIRLRYDERRNKADYIASRIDKNKTFLKGIIYYITNRVVKFKSL